MRNALARSEPPTVKQRGQVAQAVAAVQAHKPTHGEASGRIRCTRCTGTLQFVIQSTGLSRARCGNGCGITWSQ